jgi:hypothetical protein
MPLDSQGQYRHNDEAAAMHSKAASKAKMEPGAEDHVKLEDHGDGTFTTHHPGEEPVDHETIGHMHAHLSAKHGEPGHKHFHAHSDGESMHTHSADGGGEPESRMDNEEGAHDHLDEAMGSMGNEDADEGQQEGHGGGSLEDLDY